MTDRKAVVTPDISAAQDYELAVVTKANEKKPEGKEPARASQIIRNPFGPPTVIITYPGWAASETSQATNHIGQGSDVAGTVEFPQQYTEDCEALTTAQGFMLEGKWRWNSFDSGGNILETTSPIEGAKSIQLRGDDAYFDGISTMVTYAENYNILSILSYAFSHKMKIAAGKWCLWRPGLQIPPIYAKPGENFTVGGVDTGVACVADTVYTLASFFSPSVVYVTINGVVYGLTQGVYSPQSAIGMNWHTDPNTPTGNPIVDTFVFDLLDGQK